MTRLEIAVCPVTPFVQNCTFVWDSETKTGAVIDPGGDVPRILDVISELGVKIDKIVLTHGHIDHAGGAAELKAALSEKLTSASIPIEGPDERDRFLLEGLEKQGQSYGLAAQNVVPDVWLQEGETIEIAGKPFEILHCPGHTPGSLVFVNREAKLALVGDVIFRGSVGRTDFPYGDTDALINSIMEKLLPLGDDITFICGHGEASTLGAERQTNPFLFR